MWRRGLGRLGGVAIVALQYGCIAHCTFEFASDLAFVSLSVFISSALFGYTTHCNYMALLIMAILSFPFPSERITKHNPYVVI